MRRKLQGVESKIVVVEKYRDLGKIHASQAGQVLGEVKGKIAIRRRTIRRRN